MPSQQKLTRPQREFFALVADAAFANPFSAERQDLDRRISGLSAEHAPDQVVDATIATIAGKIAELEQWGGARLDRYHGVDRKLLQSALLFDVYHRFLDEFDDHIRDQLKAGDQPVPVPFARELLGLFAERGFTPREAKRYFAFFFQLRRAFYFITQSLVGSCASMRELRSRLWSNLFTHDIRWYEGYLWDRMEDFSTLLLGETGTGKGAAAAAIGKSGFIPFDETKGRFTESFTRNFIAINLSQFPETLIESELFGHRKGAFTGAINDYQGVFARCAAHGAIFLDEIGDVSVPVQIKLLQILQDRTFSPLGSHDKKRFQGRVIAATNRPLDQLRHQEKFRDDFFYRLCSDMIHIPPLRERLREDPRELALLLDEVVARLIGKPDAALSQEIHALLQASPGPAYAWPGNVRELEQAVRRILLCGSYTGEKLVGRVEQGQALREGIDAGQLNAQELLSGYCRVLYQRHGTYEAVARITGLDRRTAKKYIVED